MAMNRRRLLQRTACLCLVAGVLVGCAAAQAEPTATPAPIPSTATVTRTPVPSTSTPIPPTLTSQTADVSTDYYRFQLGDLTCVCLYDGSYNYPLAVSFPDVPVEQVQEILRQHDLSIYHVRSPYTFLYVNTGEHQVLVDMGAGREGINTGKLPQSMRAAGIDPAQIDTIIITHAHPDHIGGTLDKEGKPIYANASYYISGDEWNFWFSEEAMTRTLPMFVRTARRHLEPIQDRVNLVQGEAEIVPGVRVIPAPGHTPGHMVVYISSGDEQLLYAGDTASHPLHLEYYPDLAGLYDILPEERVASRHRIFDWVAAEKMLVIGQQFPAFPSLGYAVKSGDGWQWQPVEMTE